MAKSKTTISILLPTRGRTHALYDSLRSLIDHAADPSRVEILLGLDDDDTEPREFIQSVIADYLRSHSVECRAQIFQPLGYENLHTYVNTLASAATGDWLFVWNDDALMDTQDWDNIIEGYNGEFRLLAPTDNHDGHPYAILPVLPADWFRLMDHISLNAQNDAWVSHIAYMLDIFERIPVHITHDRADITGNNEDDTFRNRKYMEGDPDDPRDFAHTDMQQARVRTAFKLAWFLEKIGQPSEWWQRVQAGEQNPFEKMVWQKSVKGAGQLPAKPKASDEHKLVL